MTNFMRISWVALTILVVAGCNQKAPDTAAPGNGLQTASTDPKLNGGNNVPQAINKPAEQGMDLSKIPAELKGDAFEYYGLGRTEPIKMTVTQGGKSDPATQTVKLTKVEGGSAEFAIADDGGLAALGEVVVSLDKNGIKVVSVNGQKADTETFELPNGLNKGKSWPFKMETGDLKVTGTNVVSGTESVKTDVGTYKDALLVVTTGTGQQGGQKVQFKSKQWLVKGRGQVKTEISRVSGKTTQIVTMSESK